VPEISGTFPLRPTAADYRSCVWCEVPTSTLMVTPGRVDLGAVPLHALCAGQIITAYTLWRQRALEAGDPWLERLERLKRIPAASEP
jgi:hypothetical protein